MFSFVGKGKLENQKIVDITRLLTRMADMWMILIVYDFLFLAFSSRIVALMSVAFCLTLNYLIVLFPTQIYLKIPRRLMLFMLVGLRLLVLLVLIWHGYYSLHFACIIVLGLIISFISGLSNGIVILYRQPHKDEDMIYTLSRRIIYLVVPLLMAFVVYSGITSKLNLMQLMYIAFVLLLLPLPLIPFIKYRRIVVFDHNTLAFTIDGFLMCAVEYLARILVVFAIAFLIPIYIAIIVYIFIFMLVIWVAYYKWQQLDKKQKGRN